MILEASHVRYDEADGALEIDLRPSLDVRLRFGAWHAGLWCQRRVGAEWVDELHDPKLEVFGALETIPNGHHDAHPVSRFVAQLPDACRERLSAFRECQWTVLRILRTRAGMQLATSAPNLMWLLAGALADAGLADVSIAHVLAQRRHVVLAWILGRNMEPRHVRLLERITPSRRGPHERARICRVLTDERLIHAFCHAQVVTSDQIDAALGQSPYLGFRCVTRALVSDEPWQAHRIRCLIEATAWTGKQLGYSDAAQIIQSVRTPVELTRLNRRWDARRASRDAAEALRKLVAEFGAQPFPPAPISGTQDIVHVATVEALVSEGTAMRHCVGLFAQSCVEGRAAVYRVLAPERATLLLTRDAATWTLARVAGRSNCVVSDATLAAVNGWLGC